MEVGIAFIIGLVSSLLLTPFAIRTAEIMRILDRADGIRKFQKKPIPALGGIAVTGALIAACIHVVSLPHAPDDLTLLGAMLCSIIMMSILGMIDDRVGFRPKTKLLGQVLIVLPTIYVVGPIDTVVLFHCNIPSGFLAYPITIFWFLAVVNAMNLIDGMDGLASLSGLLSALGIAFVSAIHFQNVPFVATVALAGTLVGFLLFNLPKAKIYLGDCGSMSIGLILATVSMRMSPTSGVLYLTPAVLCLFLPFYDTFLAILRRGISGKNIASGDTGHVHHRLLQQGYTVWEALGTLGTVQLFFVVLGCCSVLQHYEWISWISALMMVYWCARYRFMGQNEWKQLYLLFHVLLKRCPKKVVSPANPVVAASTANVQTGELPLAGRKGKAKKKKEPSMTAVQEARLPMLEEIRLYPIDDPVSTCGGKPKAA
ncbi:MAG TPA: hypothetical protein DEB39_05205 [Planctomycetaceae bacterium]|nr:hypothetical protein [Planctomycetaceae bacterium]